MDIYLPIAGQSVNALLIVALGGVVGLLSGMFGVGGGVWGGMQPGLSRLDVGPRVSMRLRRGMRVHLDYRYKALGNAQPGSGAVVTLAGDF